MPGNSNLQNAKKAKQDEFYTLLDEIRSELNNYTDKFKDEVVYCNCDDPFESNFVKYFLMNFNRLGLKELIATGYSTSPIRGTEVDVMSGAYALRVTSTKKYLVGTQKDLDARGAKYFLEAEKDKIAIKLIGNPALDENGNQIQEAIKEKYTDENGKVKTKTIKRGVYYEAGDFRSDMSIELLKQSTIVITNPPFSLYRQYVAQLMKYKKKFLILGNMNAITYKEIFPLIKNNKMWLGCISGSKEYLVSDDYANQFPNKVYLKGSKYYAKMGNTAWFTNIDHAKRHQMLPLDLGYTYYGHEDMYPKYDNYDAINVNKVAEIPCDYEPCWYKCPHADNCDYAKTEGHTDNALCEQRCNGEIGVPITYLDKYNPEQYQIIGNAGSYKGDNSVAAELFVKPDNGFTSSEEATKLPRAKSQEPRAKSQEDQSIQENYHPPTAINAMESSEFQLPSSINIAQSNLELYGKPLETQELLHQGISLPISNTSNTKKTEEVALSSTTSEHTDVFLFKKCNGIMGVPITFLDAFCLEQFNIIDITKAGAGEKTTKTKEYSKQTQIDKYGRESSVTKLNDGANIVIKTPPEGKTYYRINNTLYIQTYPRILIQSKCSSKKQGGNEMASKCNNQSIKEAARKLASKDTSSEEKSKSAKKLVNHKNSVHKGK